MTGTLWLIAFPQVSGTNDLDWVYGPDSMRKRVVRVRFPLVTGKGTLSRADLVYGDDSLSSRVSTTALDTGRLPECAAAELPSPAGLVDLRARGPTRRPRWPPFGLAAAAAGRPPVAGGGGDAKKPATSVSLAGSSIMGRKETWVSRASERAGRDPNGSLMRSFQN